MSNVLVNCRACKGSGKHPASFDCMRCAGSGFELDPGVKHIQIRFVPKEDQKYDTMDDYDQAGGLLTFRITDTGNPVYNQLFLLHAMIERLLAHEAGISDSVITAFDLAYTGDGEPGEEPDCPYRHQHLTAKAIEMLLCAQLGISWSEYDKSVDDCINGAKQPTESSLSNEVGLHP